MEPGEFATNVLSCNEFSTIHYEFYEPTSQLPKAAKRQLQKVAEQWRRNGLITHHDPFRDGIWRFRSAKDVVSDSQGNGQDDATGKFVDLEAEDIGLFPKEKGIYEPANLARNKLATATGFSATSATSSPSSSLESATRTSHGLISRPVQGNMLQATSTGLTLPSTGSKSATSPAEVWPSPREIHENFISAVLGSVVYFLCQDYGFIPLNSRTLISAPSTTKPPGGVSNKSFGFPATEIATIDISLTSLGALVIKASCDDATRLYRVETGSDASAQRSDHHAGAALWLAPGGKAAKFYKNEDIEEMPPNLSMSEIQWKLSEDQQNSYKGVTIESWKAKCLAWLASKGLNVTALEDGGWIYVQILRASPLLPVDYPNPILENLNIVPWPVMLCFQTASSSRYALDPNVKGLEFRDPLSFAVDWYSSKDERDNASAKRLRERQVVEARAKEQAEVDSRAIQPFPYSPAAFRRGSNAGAMYPTPPDAVHHPVGVTPSFDYIASTPSHPHSLFVPDLDPSQQTAPPENNNAQVDDWPTGQQEPTSGNVLFDGHDDDNDNLFDDGGGDLFGAITDADFNFFDEPDDIHTDQQVVSSDFNVPGTQDIDDEMGLAIPERIEELPLEEADVGMPDLSSNDVRNEALLDVGESKVEEITEQIDLASERVSDNDESAIPPVVSPPFDKESVFQRIAQREFPTPVKVFGQVNFERVDFETSLMSVDKKYTSNGRFNFPDEEKSKPDTEYSDMPTTQYLNRRRNLGNLDQEPRTFSTVIDKEKIILDTEAEVPPKPFTSEIDFPSPYSEPDDLSYTADDLVIASKSGVKRKWTMDSPDDDDMTSSLSALVVEPAQIVGTPVSIMGSQLPLIEGDPADWSLTSFFTSPAPEESFHSLTDQECIAAAQILTEQCISGTSSVLGSIRSVSGSSQPPLFHTSSTRKLMHMILQVTTRCVKNITSCTMRSFLEVQGIPALNQALRLPPRPAAVAKPGYDNDSAKSVNLYGLQLPRLEVRRADAKLTLTHTAVQFWENLGLSPSRGSKDVSSVCIFPLFEGMADNLTYFVDQMRSTYESSRLGSHQNLGTHAVDAQFCYTIDLVQDPNYMQTFSMMKDIATRLSYMISSLPIDGRNIVVYFVYPVEAPKILAYICSTFQHLFNQYRKHLSDKKATVTNELVLQLIPMDMVMSIDTIVIPSPSDYFRLAMEVYDRCIEFNSYSKAPAIILEQPRPRTIDFKLTTTPSASILEENSCLHIAYAQSMDDRWITAAWTDSIGAQQMTASYCLGRKNEPISTYFPEIANEVWATTLDIISRKKIHWRLMIAKVGVMEQSEMDCWTSLASTGSDAQISLTLVTVQTDPSLRLIPQPMTLSPASNSTQAVITPVSTPQGMHSVVSPNTPANTATPGDNALELDNDARLGDLTAKCWGAVLSHRLNNSNSLLEINLALISGYLIKAGGATSEDPPVAMEINVVHCEMGGNPRTFHEGLLKEILRDYMRLATLARIRGVVDPAKDVRPWHIAAAEKAVKALYILM